MKVLMALITIALFSTAALPATGTERMLPAGEPTLAMGIPICNTLAQAEDIVDTIIKSGPTAGHDVLVKYNAQLGEDGEPVCGIYRGVLVPVKNVKAYAGINFSFEAPAQYISLVMIHDNPVYAISTNPISPYKGKINGA